MHYVSQLAETVDLFTATFDDLDRFVDSHPDWSENTCAAVVASIRSFYRHAEQTGRIPLNPAVDLVRRPRNRKPGRMATEQEIAAGLEAATTMQDQAMILLGAECGLRVAEIAGLRVDSREGEWLTVIGKGGKQRTVWCSPELGEILDLMQAEGDGSFYFPGKYGGHINSATIWRHIHKNVAVNPHSLRHRAGTVVYQQTDHDIVATQQFLGHSKPETTAIYVHAEHAALRRAGMAARIAA